MGEIHTPPGFIYETKLN